MNELLPYCMLALIVALSWLSNSPSQAAQPADAEERMLSHDVFFTLKDSSAEAKQRLVAGCKKYLAQHSGTVWFAAGVRVEELDRPVNDLGFDVALYVVFANKAAHDAYQTAPDHLKFIEEFKDNWKEVRVFDSWLEVSAHGKTAE